MEFGANSRVNPSSFEKAFQRNLFNSQSTDKSMAGSSSTSQGLFENFPNHGKFLIDSRLVPSQFCDPFDAFGTSSDKQIPNKRNSKESTEFSFHSTNRDMRNLQIRFSNSGPQIASGLRNESRYQSSLNSQEGKSMNADLSGKAPCVTSDNGRLKDDNNESRKTTLTKREKAHETKYNTVKGQWSPAEDRYTICCFLFFSFQFLYILIIGNI